MEPHPKNTATRANPMTIHPHGKTKTGTTQRLITRLIALLAIGAGSTVAWTVTAPTASAAAACSGGHIVHWTNARSYTYTAGTWCFSAGNNYSNRVMWQADGNLVWYVGNCALWWSPNTYGKGKTLNFQTDGNVVIRNSLGQPIWANGASTNGSSYYDWDLAYDTLDPVPWISEILFGGYGEPGHTFGTMRRSTSVCA